MNKPLLIALAGNPNVGKSTVFNALTGLHQHTGNWPGKTVAAARGVCTLHGETINLIDIPGAYSLWAQSAEEEAALEALCFSGADAVIAVCDAGCLERNLNLVYQILEITDQVTICVNLMDEAEKKGVRVDMEALSRRLGVPVAGTCAREGRGVQELLSLARKTVDQPPAPRRVRYPEPIEKAVDKLAESLAPALNGLVNPRFAALRLMQGDDCFRKELGRRVKLSADLEADVRNALAGISLSPEGFSALAVETIYREAEQTCRKAVTFSGHGQDRQWQADQILTGKRGIPVILALLALILFLTLKGANWLSAWLGQGFAHLEALLKQGLNAIRTPPFLQALVTEGMFRTLAQVVAVMLPPMAIFFPLFTLLEDSGYLPRAAFLMDGLFERCHACGKQALTMCMGFGCNAVGVTGCRIIDSPRERLMAILTNSLVPCNGRFPTLIALTTLFFAGKGPGGTAQAMGVLMSLALLAAGMTLLCSRVLSATVLKGVPSSFTLELPPYRKPQIGQVLVRSVLDRTLFVLGSAAAVAAPAGLIIFLLAHLAPDGVSLLTRLTGFLNPFGRMLGVDGVILSGFLLSLPANEIALPIMLMAYTAGGSMGEMADLSALGQVFFAQGWTALTALNTMLLCLFHFPCSTTLIPIYKETRSKKWTLAACLLPALIGMSLCLVTTVLSQFISRGV